MSKAACLGEPGLRTGEGEGDRVLPLTREVRTGDHSFERSSWPRLSEMVDERREDRLVSLKGSVLRRRMGEDCRLLSGGYQEEMGGKALLDKDGELPRGA